MKTKRTFWLLTIILAGFVIAALYSCSDDDEVLPDEDTPGKVFDIDGNEYKTVQIGDKIWMAENLRVKRYNNGDAIPAVLSNMIWRSTMEGAYAIYPQEGGLWPDEPVEGINSDEEMIAAYGKLYNWYAVNDPRGLCPTGWSVPGDADWTQLVYYVVSQGFPDDNVVNGAANALKSCRQVGSPLGGNCDTSGHPRWDSHGTHHGFDEFDFSALPGGIRQSGGDFGSVGWNSGWWSASEYSGTEAWLLGLGKSYGYVFRRYRNKRLGVSVRCVREIVRTEDD